MRIAVRCISLLALLLAPTLASATNATLTWNPNPESGVTGYKLYRGTGPGLYGPPRDVGAVTTFTDANGVSDLTTYYYAVSAYNDAGESPKSGEVSFMNHPPAVSLSIAPRQGPPQLTVQLNCSATDVDAGSTRSYDLDFGDGSPHRVQASPISVSHDFAGSFTASCKVTDNRNGSTSATVHGLVDSNLARPPSGNRAPATTLTGRSTGSFRVRFTCRGTDLDHTSSFTARLTFGDGASVSPPFGPSPYVLSHTYAAPGTYTAQCELRDRALGVGVGATQVLVAPGGSVQSFSESTKGDKASDGTSDSFAAQVSGELKQWHAVSVTFDGPQSGETATPNPFTDYRLDVTFTGPSEQTYKVPGYFAADGNAGETGAISGNKWRVKFCPDAPGTWQYRASFVQGAKIAAQPTGGTSAGFFDGATGSFVVAATDKPATGVDLRGKGKLEYVNDHYLRFRNGSSFIKSGSNIPETFLEYNDFDGTPPNLDYANHVVDWRTGDPTWMNGKGKGIIGAVNYLSGLGVNAMYFLTMNAYGDGRKAWPWTGADNTTNYDCSKLDQWDVVFSHMDKMGMMLHVVLSETENESYFEIKELGAAGGFAPTRKIYYREMIARFGYHLAVTWNIGEENGMSDSSTYGAANTTQQRKDASDYLRQVAYSKDNITVHNGDSGDDSIYAPLLGYESLTGPEIQWGQNSDEHGKVLYWRNASHANGHRWVVSLDEPWSSQTTMDQFRVWDVWGSYMAGAGGCEFFQTGDAMFDDFRTKEAFYLTVARARRFIENNVPFASMDPADSLLSGAAGYVLAKAGQSYLIYLPAGGTASLDLTGVSGTFDVRWFDPRNGGALQTGGVAGVTGGTVKSLGAPPNNPGLDWAALVQLRAVGSPPTAPTGLRVN
jgi:hypothetical protein